MVRQADALADRPFVQVGGEKRSYVSIRDAAARLAGAFRASGIGRGDRVAIMAENRIEMLDAFAACSWLGAILVPINTASRGPQLEHVLHNSGARALAIETALLPHLDTLEHQPVDLEVIWLLESSAERAWRGVPINAFPKLSEPVEAAPAHPGDTLAILYTSGTTGPSKGVCCPNAQFYWWGMNTGAALGVTRDDVLYTCLPLFHTNALNTFVQALVHGARFVLGPRFSASQLWTRLVEADATVTYLLGTMVSELDPFRLTPGFMRPLLLR